MPYIPTKLNAEVPEGLFCLKCGYELSYLTTRTCPECGEAFDPVHVRRVQQMQRFDVQQLVTSMVIIAFGSLIASSIPLVSIFGMPIALVGFIIYAGFVARGLAEQLQGYQQYRRGRHARPNQFLYVLFFIVIWAGLSCVSLLCCYAGCSIAIRIIYH